MGLYKVGRVDEPRARTRWEGVILVAMHTLDHILRILNLPAPFLSSNTTNIGGLGQRRPTGDWAVYQKISTA